MTETTNSTEQTDKTDTWPFLPICSVCIDKPATHRRKEAQGLVCERCWLRTHPGLMGPVDNLPNLAVDNLPAFDFLEASAALVQAETTRAEAIADLKAARLARDTPGAASPTTETLSRLLARAADACGARLDAQAEVQRLAQKGNSFIERLAREEA